MTTLQPSDMQWYIGLSMVSLSSNPKHSDWLTKGLYHPMPFVPKQTEQ